MRSEDPILAPYPPEDFDDFWERTVSGRSVRPPAFVREHRSLEDTDTHRVDRIDFKGNGEQLLRGWIAVPHGHREPQPAFLWIPAYGLDSHIPDEYSCYPGFVSLSYNIHGLPTYHREPYMPDRGYFASGIEDPEKWIFRGFVLDALRALEVLAAQPEVDATRLGCAGMSQGGGMALMLACATDRLRAVCADEPFLSSMPWSMKKAYRYPYKEFKDWADKRALGMETVLSTLSYFDTLNCAARARCPALVSYGDRDPACPPNTVEAIARALPEPRRLVVYKDHGHEWHPDMPANNAEWLRTHMV